MARGGVYRSDVEKARNALISRGKNASVDAVRVELGNTGSKTTIHRHLKELEAEDERGGKFPISDELAELVRRLAARLNEEADAKIAQTKERFDTELRVRAAEAEHAQSVAAGLADRLQRTEAVLEAERTAHEAARDALGSARLTIGQFEERVAGLTTRIDERAAHVQSLESKHQQARDALEHFRTAAKEQRDQEHRRHEHQVQGLQVERRQAQDALTGKNQELLRLNQDNGRLAEQAGQLTKDLQATRAEVRQRDRELESVRPVVAEHQALKARWGTDVQALALARD